MLVQTLKTTGAVAALMLMAVMSHLYYEEIDEINIYTTTTMRRKLAIKCKWQFWNKKTSCQDSNSEEEIRGSNFVKEGQRGAISKWMKGNRRAGNGTNGIPGGNNSAQTTEASQLMNKWLGEGIGVSNENKPVRKISSDNVSDSRIVGSGCENEIDESRAASNLTMSIGESPCSRTVYQPLEALYSLSSGKMNVTSNGTSSDEVARVDEGNDNKFLSYRVAEVERSRAKRIAVCLTGQVRSFEEISGNLRDMIVRPLQQLVDLPINISKRNNFLAAAMPSLRKFSSNLTGNHHYTSSDSNVHIYATIALNDTLEMKGFRCTKTKHSRQKVTEILASLGAPVYGFIEDDEKSRSGPINGCKAWPGFVQADQMKQCWAMATATEKRQGWQYDYALRVRPDVAYKRSFRLAHWPLFAPLVQDALWYHHQLHGGSQQTTGLAVDHHQIKHIHNGQTFIDSDSKDSNNRNHRSHGERSNYMVVKNPNLRGAQNGVFGDLESLPGKVSRKTLFAWAPCKCQAKEIETSDKFKWKRAQDVLWAVPRAAADALFSTAQEYLHRGCATASWKGSPPPHWLKKCPMYVDGRDNYECMFILRLARFNIGYEVYIPPMNISSNDGVVDNRGWKILRPSWCTNLR